MPNHIHFVIWLKTWPQGIVEQPDKADGFTHAQSGSVGAIVGNYKSQVSKRINNVRRTQGAQVWQAGYWDRIVRNEVELNRIRQYIVDNPSRREEDRENLDALLKNMIYHP